jgi:TRAP-type C4-dicarboxylate transport system permease small subunit
MTKFSLRKILAVWYRFEDLALSFCLLAMIILACLQIALRVFFSSGLVWADPLLRYLVLWSGLLGAVVATRMGKHIAIDLISHLVPKSIFHWLLATIQFFSMAVCLVLTYAATTFVINEASFDSGRMLLGLTSWQLNLIFPISFGLISLHFLIEMLSGIWQSLRPTSPC